MRHRLPAGGLFANQEWRIAPTAFRLEPGLAVALEKLGRVLLQFNRAANLLYRQSVAGKQPGWVAEWLDRGKPRDLVERQRHPTFKHDLPRVIRPDILLTERGFAITELDAVPGGIGLTAWLLETYSSIPGPRPTAASTGEAPQNMPRIAPPAPSPALLGGARGMQDGFAAIFGDAPRVHIVVSEEAATYRPEMVWLAERLNGTSPPSATSEAADREAAASSAAGRFAVRTAEFTDFQPGDAVYRFFELFDLANVPNAKTIFDRATDRQICLTPPPKPLFEEKLLLALLWNRNLRGFWRQELGEGFFSHLLEHVPYTWVVDPVPLPPHAAIPELNLTDWHQLKTLSQRERELVLKISGYSEKAWGARSVSLGSDLSVGDWSAAVDDALRQSARSPYVLQRYHKPRTIPAAWFDFARQELVPLAGRVRLCPYYFVVGDGDAARTRLGGVLATICPADKKIIHGMQDAILAPCEV